jgi:hypothetical protein
VFTVSEHRERLNMSLVPPTRQGNVSLIPTGDLITELMTRFDHIVFSGIQNRPASADAKDGRQILSRRYAGDAHLCIGLADGITMLCRVDIENAMEELNVDDL